MNPRSHGTDSCYNGGCRCDPCRAAHARAQKEWRAGKRAGRKFELAEWGDDAACKGKGDLMFPADGSTELGGKPPSPALRARYEQARALCESCPVQAVRCVGRDDPAGAATGEGIVICAHDRMVPRSLGLHETRPVIAEWRCVDCGHIGEWVNACSIPEPSMPHATIAEKNEPGTCVEQAPAPAKTPGRSQQ